MLGTAPARATKFDLITDEAQDGVGSDTQPLTGTDFQAVASDLENPEDANKYIDVIWLDDKGIVRDSGSGPVDSALIPGTTNRVYAAAKLQRMGVFAAETSVAGPLSSDPEGVGVLQYGTFDEVTSTWTWTATKAVVDGPVSDLDVTSSEGTVASTPVVVQGAIQGTFASAFVNITATRVGKEAPKLLSATFRGYSGQPRTFTTPSPESVDEVGVVVRSFGLTAQDAELVALRVEQRRPATIGLAQVLMHRRPVGEEALDLLVTGAVGRGEVEVEPVLDRLALGHLDEQHPLAPIRTEDHAFLVTRQVRVLRVLRPAEHLTPPVGLGVRVV